MTSLFRSRPRAVALLFVAAALSAAQDLDHVVLKTVQAIDAKRAEMHIPGVGLAIVKDGKVVYAGGLGFKDLERKRKVTADTQFAIGSSTKAFIAMLLAMGEDEGKVRFADHPRKYVPYFRLSDPDADNKITVGGLLSHGSGLPRTDLVWAPGVLSTEEIIWAVGRAKPTAEYGKKFQYQNVMYAAAGEVLRGAYGKSWEMLIRERIFDPLGMARTNTSVKEMTSGTDFALGYEWRPYESKHRRLPMRDLPAIGAAGAINSSAKEMAKWVQLMLQQGEADGKRLVSKDRFAELTKPRMTISGNAKYGYGWFMQPWDTTMHVQHGGNIDGFSALVSFLPEKNVGFALLMNLNAAPLGPTAADIIYSSLVGKSPESNEKVELKNPEREVGTYRLDIAKLDFAVTLEGGKLFVTPSGQPKMELIPIGERRFKVGPPAPDKVFVTFRQSKDDPKVSEAELEQGGAKMALVRPKPFEAPMTVEALMAKVVEATGGEAAMRKVKTLTYRYVVDMENQGAKIFGMSQKQAPDLSADLANFTVGGRRIGTAHVFYDGVQAVDDTDFAPVDVKGGPDAGDLILGGMLFQELDWSKTFKSVAITGKDKVNGEEVLVVEKTPVLGNKVVDYVSTTSYLVLKRVSGVGPGASSDSFSDFRAVSGVQMPFKFIRENAIMGKFTMIVEDMQVNGPVDSALFRLLERKAS